MITPLSEASFTAAALGLAAGDSHLKAIIDAHDLPEFWHRPPTVATLALFIVEQQVSLDSAKAVFERMVSALGEVTADTLADSPDETLRAVGLTRQKLRYLRGLGESVRSGAFDLEDLAHQPDPEARVRLLELTGIGPWTADVYLLASLRRPDVWPVGDRALQVGVGECLGLDSPPSPGHLEDLGERWRPYRSVAARLIWHDYLQRRGRSETRVRGLVTGSPDHS